MLNKLNLLVSILLISSFPLYAQPVDFGVGVNFAPGSGGNSEVHKSTAVPKSVFVKHIAKKMNKDEVKLQGLWRRGYGFVELIKLSLIADGANETFEKIVEQREKKQKLKAIAQKYNLNYNGIYRRSYEIKSELEAEVTDYLTETAEPETSSPTIKQR